jgi:hypothetical protein
MREAFCRRHRGWTEHLRPSFLASMNTDTCHSAAGSRGWSPSSFALLYLRLPGSVEGYFLE